jgi:peptide deformylase
MAVKRIVTNNHPTLRTVSTPVERFEQSLEALIQDLLETLDHAGEVGVGLSANQIDTTSRVFVARIYPDGDSSAKKQPRPTVFINPQITKSSTETTITDDPERTLLEGCLSLPNIYAFVERPNQVTLTFHTVESFKKAAEPITKVFAKDNAVVVQHEIDHLDGILFTDRALAQGQKIYEIKEGKQPRILEI